MTITKKNQTSAVSFIRTTDPSFPDAEALPKKQEDEKKFDKKFNEWWEEVRLNLSRLEEKLGVYGLFELDEKTQEQTLRFEKDIQDNSANVDAAFAAFDEKLTQEFNDAYDSISSNQSSTDSQFSSVNSSISQISEDINTNASAISDNATAIGVNTEAIEAVQVSLSAQATALQAHLDAKNPHNIQTSSASKFGSPIEIHYSTTSGWHKITFDLSIYGTAYSSWKFGFCNFRHVGGAYPNSEIWVFPNGHPETDDWRTVRDNFASSTVDTGATGDFRGGYMVAENQSDKSQYLGGNFLAPVSSQKLHIQVYQSSSFYIYLYGGI